MIGIDINQQSIKVVVMERVSTDQYHIVRAGISEWRNESHENPDEILRKQKHALQVLKDACKIKDGSAVILSLPSNTVFIRYLDILKADKRKEAEFVRYEARQQIPFPLEEVAWDHVVITPKDSSRKQAVLMAVKKDLLESNLDVLRSARLRSSFVNLGLINVVNAALIGRVLKRNETGILVDIGSQSTGVVIYRKGEIWLRSFSHGTRAMLDDIAATLGITVDEADTILRNPPETKSPSQPQTAQQVKKIVSEHLGKIADEIERSLAFFKTECMQKYGEAGGLSSDDIRLVLVGGICQMGGVETFFNAQLGIKTQLLKWSSRITAAPALPRNIACVSEQFSSISEDDMPALFAVAIGAALAQKGRPDFSINFLRHQLLGKSMQRTARLFSFLSIAVVLCAVIVFGVTEGLLTRINKERLQRVETVLKAFDQYRNDVIHLAAEKKDLKAQADFFIRYMSKRYVWLEAFSAIAKVAPLNIWFEKMEGVSAHDNVPADVLTIEGYMLSYDDFNDFIENIKEFDFITLVKPEAIESDDGRFRFRLALTIDSMAFAKM